MVTEGQLLSADMLSGRIKIDWEHPLPVYEISGDSDFFQASLEQGGEGIVKAGKSTAGQARLAREIAFYKVISADTRALLLPFRVEKNPRDVEGSEALVMPNLKSCGYQENFQTLVENATLPERRIIFIDLMAKVSELISFSTKNGYALTDILGNLAKGIWYKKARETGRFSFVVTDFGGVNERSVQDMEPDSPTNIKALLIQNSDGTTSLLTHFFSSFFHLEDSKIVVTDEILESFRFRGESLEELLTQILNGDFDTNYNLRHAKSSGLFLALFFSDFKKTIPTETLLTAELEHPSFNLQKFIGLLISGDNQLSSDQLQRYAAHFGLTTQALREQLAAAQEKLETK